jgi:hypothetical protein
VFKVRRESKAKLGFKAHKVKLGFKGIPESRVFRVRREYRVKQVFKDTLAPRVLREYKVLMGRRAPKVLPE